MAKRKNRLNTPLSLLSTVLLMVWLVPVIVLPFIHALGGFGEIITDIVELIPFGYTFHEIALMIINSMTGQVVNYHAIRGVLTIPYVTQELAEGIFTIIVYEALRLAWFIPMDLIENGGGRWNGMKKMVISVAMAVVAACLAPALINWTFSGMRGLGNSLKTFFASMISAVLLGGGVAFFAFLKGLSIGVAILFVALKFFFVGALRLSVSYLCLMILLVGCEQNLWSLIIGGSSGFLCIALALAGLELMIDSAFSK